jgi:hypothetical protein
VKLKVEKRRNSVGLTFGFWNSWNLLNFDTDCLPSHESRGLFLREDSS